MGGKIMALVLASLIYLNGHKTNNIQKKIKPIFIIDDDEKVLTRQVWTKDEENVGRNFNIILYIIQLVFFCNCLQIVLEPLICRFFYTLWSSIISIHLGALVCVCLKPVFIVMHDST